MTEQAEEDGLFLDYPEADRKDLIEMWKRIKAIDNNKNKNPGHSDEAGSTPKTPSLSQVTFGSPFSLF